MYFLTNSGSDEVSSNIKLDYALSYPQFLCWSFLLFKVKTLRLLCCQTVKWLIWNVNLYVCQKLWNMFEIVKGQGLASSCLDVSELKMNSMKPILLETLSYKNSTLRKVQHFTLQNRERPEKLLIFKTAIRILCIPSVDVGK